MKYTLLWEIGFLINTIPYVHIDICEYKYMCIISLFIHFLERAMAPYSSTLAWGIPWAEEPGGLQSMGSQRVGHDWATSLSLFTFMHWRKRWQPTPMFLPGESQGQGSLMSFHLWGRAESDTTEVTWQHTFLNLFKVF